MTRWISFGASVMGPGHIAAGMPNQDAWLSFHPAWGDGIVVSDGLGSKPFSDFGSRAACRSVVGAVHSCHGNAAWDAVFLSERIKSNWLSIIAPIDARDCAATCVFAFRIHDGMVCMGMLGDGIAAAVKTDGSVEILSDDKSDGFSNITAALSPEVTAKDWRWRTMPEDDCQSIVLCSDGVADDLSDAAGFVKEFAAVHRSLTPVAAVHSTRTMLENWPTPKHTDDKTIACLFREEIANE